MSAFVFKGCSFIIIIIHFLVCYVRGLNREDAMVRSRWRKQIGMIDDHDECEWVNVSCGTGLPGLSRTKSTEPYKKA